MTLAPWLDSAWKQLPRTSRTIWYSAANLAADVRASGIRFGPRGSEWNLEISGRPFDKAKAARGDVLFHDGAKGNCYDCHGDNGAGIDTFGSTNLTRPDLYLYGADRGSIRESIIKGRHGKMPAFGGVLKPEELKAVSVYVFSRAAQK